MRVLESCWQVARNVSNVSRDKREPEICRPLEWWYGRSLHSDRDEVAPYLSFVAEFFL